ncbi:MAG: hypothetical protein LBE35_06520 [Clostridiales bacterium]|jgi:hypothetical protein|nr:hypothetical protein [Clostridiales bacterium]
MTIFYFTEYTDDVISFVYPQYAIGLPKKLRRQYQNPFVSAEEIARANTPKEENYDSTY